MGDIDWATLYGQKNEYLGQFYEELTPFEFYREIFPPGTFERAGVPEDHKPNGLALIIKGDRRAYHRLITDDLAELDMVLKEDFAVMSPIGYFGERRLGRNARYLYAVCFDLDGVEMQHLTDLLYQMENGVTPKATYIVNSGRGLHLYYLLDTPVPMYPKNQNYLRELKIALTKVIWNQYTSNRAEPETQSVLQGFRVIGTPSKLGQEYPVRAFRIGEAVSLDYLMSFVIESNGDLAKVKEALAGHKMSLEEAKEKYPEWYDRRIVRKQPRGQWAVKPDLYYWWLKRLKSEIRVGHRYNGVLALAVYAQKCPAITEEQLREDAYSLIETLDKMTTDPKNHFTKEDVEDALEAYNDEDNDTYVRWRRDYIEHLTALPMPKNKRNGRTQAAHLARARAVQAVDYPDGSWRGNPSQEARVWDYLDKHPDASKSKIADDLSISKPCAIKHFKTWQERQREKEILEVAASLLKKQKNDKI